MRHILLILLSLIQMGAQVAPAAPTDVMLAWASPTTARIDWTQQSNADQVCIDGTDNAVWVFHQCIPSKPGTHTLIITPTRLTAPQYYYILEWRGGEIAGDYGAYVLPSRDSSPDPIYLPTIQT